MKTLKHNLYILLICSLVALLTSCSEKAPEKLGDTSFSITLPKGYKQTKDKTMEAYLTKSDALDLGIKQRLLTKIKGSERQIGYLVGTTLRPDVEPTNSELLNLFKSEEAQQISHFEATQKELKRKALELGVHGYTN